MKKVLVKRTVTSLVGTRSSQTIKSVQIQLTKKGRLFGHAVHHSKVEKRYIETRCLCERMNEALSKGTKVGTTVHSDVKKTTITIQTHPLHLHKVLGQNVFHEFLVLVDFERSSMWHPSNDMIQPIIRNDLKSLMQFEGEGGVGCPEGCSW